MPVQGRPASTRSLGVALLYGFSDARLEALSPGLHERGLLLVRANEVDSAVVLLEQVKVRVVILAQEADRRALARITTVKKVRVLVDPQLEAAPSVEQLMAEFATA